MGVRTQLDAVAYRLGITHFHGLALIVITIWQQKQLQCDSRQGIHSERSCLLTVPRQYLCCGLFIANVYSVHVSVCLRQISYFTLMFAWWPSNWERIYARVVLYFLSSFNVCNKLSETLTEHCPTVWDCFYTLNNIIGQLARFVWVVIFKYKRYINASAGLNVYT